MSETNADVNRLVKEKHDLIRMLERKEITQEEFDKFNKEIDESIKEARDKLLTEDESNEAVIEEKKYEGKKRGKKPRDNSDIIGVLTEGAKDINDATSKLQQHTTISRQGCYQAIKKFLLNIPEQYYFDRAGFKLYKKEDMIDEEGKPIR